MYRVYGTYLRIAGQSENEYNPEHHHGQGEKLGQLVRVNRHDVHIPRQWNHVLLNKLFDRTFFNHKPIDLFNVKKMNNISHTMACCQ